MVIQENTEKEILRQAQLAEAENDLEHAAELYKKEIKRHPLKVYPYDRLMIIYRKSKRYKDEWQIVNRGIKAFEDYFKNRAEKLSAKNKRLTRLSKALIKSTGLSEKNHEYFPEPLNKWRKRKEVVKKLKTS